MGEFVPACGRDERYCKRRTLRGGFHCCAYCVARGAFTIRLHSLIFGNQLSETVNVNTLYWMCRQLFDGFVHLTSSWRIRSVHTDDVTCVDKYPIMTRVFRVLGSCSHVDLRCLSAPFWLEMALQRLQPVYGVLYCTDCILDWGHPERYKHAQSCLCNLFLLYYIIHGLDVFFMPIFTGNSDFSTVFVLWVRVPPTFGELKLRISITTEHRAKHVTKSGCIYICRNYSDLVSEVTRNTEVKWFNIRSWIPSEPSCQNFSSFRLLRYITRIDQGEKTIEYL